MIVVKCDGCGAEMTISRKETIEDAMKSRGWTTWGIFRPNGWVNTDNIERYHYCPICEKKRAEKESAPQ